MYINGSKRAEMGDEHCVYVCMNMEEFYHRNIEMLEKVAIQGEIQG
jgi:hypothetical protein